jgi:hypothetical protein
MTFFFLHIHIYMHTTHSLCAKWQQTHLRYSFDTPTFYQNDLGMRIIVHVTGGKSIIVCVPSMSLHRMILLDQRLRLTRGLYGHFRNAFFFIDYPPRRFTRSSKFRTSQTRSWPTDRILN